MSCRSLGWLPNSMDPLTGPPALPCSWIQGNSFVTAPGWRTLNTSCAARPYSLTSLDSEKRGFIPHIFPTSNAKQDPQAQQNQCANHLPSALELGRNGANSWKNAKPWMQLPHQCLPRSSSPSCLLYPLSVSGGQSQQPCLQRRDRSACAPGMSLNYQICSYCHLV